MGASLGCGGDASRTVQDDAAKPRRLSRDGPVSRMNTGTRQSAGREHSSQPGLDESTQVVTPEKKLLAILIPANLRIQINDILKSNNEEQRIADMMPSHFKACAQILRQMSDAGEHARAVITLAAFEMPVHVGKTARTFALSYATHLKKISDTLGIYSLDHKDKHESKQRSNSILSLPAHVERLVELNVRLHKFLKGSATWQETVADIGRLLHHRPGFVRRKLIRFIHGDLSVLAKSLNGLSDIQGEISNDVYDLLRSFH
jgi:hypothetical protein